MKKNPSAAESRSLFQAFCLGLLAARSARDATRAHAQGGSPFDSGMTAIQTLFTGTIAKVSSLIAIVIGGYTFAHGEPGAKQVLGDLSLTIVLYDRDRAMVEHEVADFAGIFTNQDGLLFPETYNQLNALFAVIPGNYAQNLRKMYLLLANYADPSFFFTVLQGEKRNHHLGTEYLAVLETDNATLTT